MWVFYTRGILKPSVMALPKGQKAGNKLPGWNIGQNKGAKCGVSPLVGQDNVNFPRGAPSMPHPSSVNLPSACCRLALAHSHSFHSSPHNALKCTSAGWAKEQECFLWSWMGTLLRLLFFPMQLHTKKKKNPSSPSVLQQMFFHFFFKVWGVFLQFFSLKIANLKNQICGGVWFKMEKPSDFVLCAEQEFWLDGNKLQPALCSPLSS